MAYQKAHKLKTISEFHRLMGAPLPDHPLMSVIKFDEFNVSETRESIQVIFDFYIIALKRMKGIKYKYGQQYYDFDNDGVLYFVAPNQVVQFEFEEKNDEKPSGWAILIHPDFLWNTTLANINEKYDFFDYSLNEALFLSEKEETILNGIIENIKQEYHSNIDNFSKQIITTHTENLLSYSNRFYNRQFITREKAHHSILEQLENLFKNYFSNIDEVFKGIPTVQYLASELNISPKYLSRLLKSLTGQSAQQFIHEKLIEKAKEKLSTTELTISEIAYELGFEHPQSFSRLFKSKSGVSPLEFRNSFN
jgi:AraC family transcriptional regulator, transcriptional activator of pobA